MCYGLILVLTVAGLVPGIWIVSKVSRWMRYDLARIERTVDGSDYGVERTRSRIQLLSIRTNVLALALISVVGFLTFSIEVYRTIWPDSSFSSVALEELLQSKLPSPQVQQRWHEETIDAIRGMKSPEQRQPGS